MWPDGHLSITEVTKRPLTAATLFKNSIVALVDKLACKVSQKERFTIMIVFESRMTDSGEVLNSNINISVHETPENLGWKHSNISQ